MDDVAAAFGVYCPNSEWNGSRYTNAATGVKSAGKSTLMKILFGMDVIWETGGYSGDVLINGQKAAFSTPFDALAAGIGMVHQEFSLIPGFTAAENILLNREPQKKTAVSEVFGERLNTLDYKEMDRRSGAAIEKMGVAIDANMTISNMPVGHKQFTKIARELSKDQLKLLILDEPTAVLTEKEADALLESIRNMAAQGISIIFITHRLHEILAVCDKVVVMRDGCVVRDVPAGETSVEDITRRMVGRDVQSAAGAVRTEAESGGRTIPLNSPRRCLDSSLAFVSEDRRGVGLLLDESLEWNVAFPAMQIQNKFLKRLLGGAVKWRDERGIHKVTQKYIDELQIKCTSSRQKARELSGGNQQKVCLAKAFALEPRFLFVSEPTRGIDAGAKALVLESLKKFNRESGVTVVMISSELEELRQTCDRIAIVSGGRIAGILPAATSSEEFGMLMVSQVK